MDEVGNQARSAPTHCPWCDYPRTGLDVEARCPECGEVIPPGWLILCGEPNISRGGFFATPWRMLRWALVGLLITVLLLVVVATSTPAALRAVGPFLIAQLLVALVPLAGRLFLREPRHSTLWISDRGIGQKDDDLITRRLRWRIAACVAVILAAGGVTWVLWTTSMVVAISAAILCAMALVVLVVEWHRNSFNVETSGSSVEFFTPWSRVKSLSIRAAGSESFRVRAKLHSRIEASTIVDIEIRLDAIDRRRLCEVIEKYWPYAEASCLREDRLRSASEGSLWP